jgi:signal transduction histidine kinase
VRGATGRGSPSSGVFTTVMDRHLAMRHALGLAVGAAGITAVTAVVWALGGLVPASALGGLYVLAVLPVASKFGFVPALMTAALSALVFDFLFFPPFFSLALQNPQDAIIVLISAVTAGVVSGLAERARQRAREVEALAREQAALRRIATLVARAAPPAEVFAAVAAEAGQLMGCESTMLCRYDPGGEATAIGAWSADRRQVARSVGTPTPVEGQKVTVLVFQTGQPARLDHRGTGTDPVSAAWSPARMCSLVGAPIRVDDHLWGVMIAAARNGRLPRNVEARLAAFTELVGTAISNAEAKAQLIVSRARIVGTADATRRRIERDLHDGVQQHLISLTLTLRTAQAAAPPAARELADRLDKVIDGMGSVIDELREIARGIHPSALAQGGLYPALKALARRSTVPVRLDVRVEGRLPEQIEVAAYYAIAEALTNAVKHARASVVDVAVDVVGGVLRVRIGDDGCGGANPAEGSGLVGLEDRVEALGGQFWLASPAGAGTTVQAALPLDGPQAPGLLPTGSTPADLGERTGVWAAE